MCGVLTNERAASIDGVLLRSAQPVGRSPEALALLQRRGIPFILLTNGGGRHESDRVAELSRALHVPLDLASFVQSHTPFAELAAEEGGLREECILVIGGDGDNCRQVALRYGFRNVVTPADIVTAYPAIWPFSKALAPHYKSVARPLPRPIDPANPSHSLRIHAIFVFSDPRDWALDTQIMLDALLSSGGVLGTRSPLNDHADHPNRGFQQDGQPRLYFSNPDLWWAAQYHLPRLGQGGFREAFEGVWAAVTGGRDHGVALRKTVIGKPSQATFEFAEARLNMHRKTLLRDPDPAPLKTVYFIGDNPESDIRGANEYVSPWKSRWYSVLVRTGVYSGQQPDRAPTRVVKDVWEAVQWALEQSNAPKAS
ncbi:MAG: hypothetical protein M1826_003274 [Phylliscum demangeonii]|nr:MAG: hypothetical protein M1826_003274 [Phylliscum demangeonii]